MNKKVINKVIAATVFTSAAVMPFFFMQQEAKAQEETLKLAICEPFPECFIYRVDEAPAVNNEL